MMFYPASKKCSTLNCVLQAGLAALIIGLSACATHDSKLETEKKIENPSNEQQAGLRTSNPEWMKISPNIQWPDEALKERFLTFWQAYHGRDWAIAHTFEAPFFQTHYDAEFYAKYHEKAHPLVDFEVFELKQEDARTLIRLRLEFRDPKTGKLNEMTFWDEWIKIDNHWFHVLVDSLLRKLVEEKQNAQAHVK